MAVSKNQRMFGALLAFVPSVVVLFGTKVSKHVIPFTPGTIMALLLCIWIPCCYLGFRMIFRRNSILVGIYSIIFLMMNLLISLFIGCAQGTIRID